MYSDKSTRFRRKGELVEKEAWVEILLRRIAVVKGIFGSRLLVSRVIAEESISRNVKKGLDGSWNQIQDSDFKNPVEL